MTRFLSGLLVGAVAALTLGYQLWRVAPVVETPLPEVRQADSSLVLERAPDATAKPKHQIPEGTTLERVVTVTVQPDPVVVPTRDSSTSTDSARATPTSCECGPLDVYLSFVRKPDGSRRIIASAKGGNVLGGVDVPVESATPPRVLKWSAGPVRAFETGQWGIAISRDFESLAVLSFPYEAELAHLLRARDGGSLTMLGMKLRF